MSERLRNNLIKYGITGAVCLIYAAVHCFSRDVETMVPVDLYRTVSDSFMVPGMVCVFSGLVTWLSNEGAFNGIGYVMPQRITLPADEVKVFFRVSNPVKSPTFRVVSDGKVLLTRKRIAAFPGEMETLTLTKEMLADLVGDVIVEVQND